MKSDKRVPPEARIIGANIRALRRAAGLSQKDVGRALGISYQQIQKYEIGTNRFPVEKLFYLKNFYNVPYEIFFSDFAAANGDMSGMSDLSLFVQLGKLENKKMKNKIEGVLRILLS